MMHRQRRTLRIATRKSPLALWQAQFVKHSLQQHYPHLTIELVGLVTAGDKFLATSLAKIGGKGLFVKELEQALLAEQADIAVHSVKDMPVELPAPFVLAAICERADARDTLIANHFADLVNLPIQAKVGTSSLRRSSQLKLIRPDLIIENVRGNVGTRLQKLDEGQFDALILAAAGIERLGLAQRIRAYLTPEQMLPAVGQGAIGIECRQQDDELIDYLRVLDHWPTRQCINAERAMNHALGGSCQLPVAAYAQIHDQTLYIRGLVADPTQAYIIRAEKMGEVTAAEQLGQSLADDLIAQGADTIIKAVLAKS